MGNPLKAINKIKLTGVRRAYLKLLIDEILPKSINGFAMIDDKPVNVKRIKDWVSMKTKESEIYGLAPRSIKPDNTPYILLQYEPNKYVKFLGRDGLEFLDDVYGQIPRVLENRLSKPYKMANTVKDYLLTANRKKVRKAGLSEKAIDELINNLHDTTFILGPDHPDINGRSIVNANTIHFNTFSNNNQYETAIHELTHSFNNDAPSKTGEIKNHLNKNNLYTNRASANYIQKREAYNKKILDPIIEKKKKKINAFKNKNQSRKDAELLDYFLDPEEMRAKIGPILINAYKQHWTPKLAVKYIRGTYDTNFLHALFDNNSLAELIDKIILKNGGKIKQTT